MTEKQPNQQTTHNQDIRQKRLKRAAKFGGGVCGSILLFESMVGVSAVSRMEEPSPEKVIKAVTRTNDNVINFVTNRDNCPPAPDPSDISHLVTAVSHQSNSAERIAEKHHVELIDFDEMMEIVPTLRAATSTQEVTAAASSFTQEHMKFKIHANQIHQDESIDLKDYKDQMWPFLYIMKDIPVDLYSKMEIEDIVFRSEGITHSKNLAEHDPLVKQVTINFEQLDSPRTILHEVIGHGIHDAICANSRHKKDIAFHAANPSGHKYTEDNWRNAQFNYDGHVSHYSTKNIFEDYAETNASYFTGAIEPDLMDTDNALDKKVKIILERLDSMVPGSAEYLSGRITRFAQMQYVHEERLKDKSDKR